jgi:predicted Zn-dependent protease with MMP-like domain
MILTNSVRTSQETHYVTATKPNRLMLFRETVAVYCENHTEHITTLCAEYIAIQSVPHRKHIMSPLRSPTG